MNKPKLSRSVNCFGLQWINQEKHLYKITHKVEFLKSTFKDMVESGFDAVELGTLGPWNREEELENYPFVEDAVKIIRDYGLDFHSVHLPFSCQLWNFSSLDETERKLSVESVKRAVSHYEKDMPNLFVMHPDARPKSPSERSARMEQLIKSFDEICEFAPRAICLENMTDMGLLYTSAEAKVILDAVPKLYMTLDTNHTIHQVPESYILDIGSRIKNVHISDRDEGRECHYVPGKGILNWDNIMNAFDSIGYEGAFVYEVRDDIPSIQLKENFDWLMTKLK